MALLAAETTLIRDLWPADIPRVRNDDKPFEALSAKQIVPQTLEDLEAWAWIKGSNRHTRNRWKLVHAVDDSDDIADATEVAIRVQGFVVDCDLRVLGDWNREPAGAAAARQYLIIDGGLQADVFGKQIEALNGVRQMIAKATKSRTTQDQGRRRLHMYRSVFTKKVPGGDFKNYVTKEDDPSGMARKIGHRWIIADKIMYGKLDATGNLVIAKANEIRKGDFIDVKLVPEIYQPRGAHGRDVKVSFKMTRVVKLQAAKQKEADVKRGNEEANHQVSTITDEWDEKLGEGGGEVSDVDDPMATEA